MLNADAERSSHRRIAARTESALNVNDVLHSRRALRRSRRAVAHRQPRAGGAPCRRRVHQRHAPVAVLRRVGRLCRAPRLRRRRRHPPRRLAPLRADGSVLHQGVRGRHQLELLGAARRVEVDGVRQPRHHQARIRQDAGRLPDLSRAQAARSRRPRRLRLRHRRARAAVGEAHGRRAAHARPAVAVRRPAACGRRCTRWPSTSDAAVCWC